MCKRSVWQRRKTRSAYSPLSIGAKTIPASVRIRRQRLVLDDGHVRGQVGRLQTVHRLPMSVYASSRLLRAQNFVLKNAMIFANMFKGIELSRMLWAVHQSPDVRFMGVQFQWCAS